MGRNKRHRGRRNHSRAHNKTRRSLTGQQNERSQFDDNNYTNLRVVERRRPLDDEKNSASPERIELQNSKSTIASSEAGVQNSKNKSNIGQELKSIDSQESTDDNNERRNLDVEPFAKGTINISLNDCDVYNSQPLSHPNTCSCSSNNQSTRQPPIIVVEPKHDESMQCDCTSCQFFSGWCCMPCMLFIIIALIIIWWCIANKTYFTGGGTGGGGGGGSGGGSESGPKFDDISEQY